MRYYIKEVKFNYESREVEVKLSNGSCVKICECCESWEQYNATTDEKWVSVGIAEIVNEWLHGGDESEEMSSEINNEIIAVATEWLKDNENAVFGRIDDFEVRREVAMGVMDWMRCPLRQADNKLYNEMQDALSEWCDDNEFDVDEFDLEQIVF